jgi:hypothetical protein
MSLNMEHAMLCLVQRGLSTQVCQQTNELHTIRPSTFLNEGMQYEAAATASGHTLTAHPIQSNPGPKLATVAGAQAAATAVTGSSRVACRLGVHFAETSLRRLVPL